MFFENLLIFTRGLYSHVYELNLGLCGASSTKNLTKKKQKSTVHNETFGTKLDMVFDAEFVNYQYLINSFFLTLYTACKNEHLHSL